MKLSKILGVLAIAAMALMAFAGTASATTTLEVGGVKKAESLVIEASLKSGTSALLSDTFGAFANTCTGSTVKGKTVSPFTGSATVGGPVETLSFKPCTKEEVIVDKAGSLTVENIAGTTNGTVRSIGAEVTVPTEAFGLLNCKTAASPGTDIGTITGVASGNATMDIKATLNCGAITATWTGTYITTGANAALGVTS